jgi:hypothetical protein
VRINCSIDVCSDVVQQLVWHGQKLLVYPAAYLDPKPRRRSSESMHKSLHLFISFTGVISPRYYGLQYEDVELLTSDKIILRCYLLLPAKTSSRTEASKTSEPIELEAAVVCRRIQSCFNHDVAR